MDKIKESIEILLNFLEGQCDTEETLNLYKLCNLESLNVDEIYLINNYLSSLCGDNLEIPSETIYDEIESYLVFLLRTNVSNFLFLTNKSYLINKIDFNFIDVKELRCLLFNI